MFETFKNQFIIEMTRQGVDKENQRTVLRCLNFVAANYTFQGKEANIVEYTNPNNQLLDYYIACKTVEGLSKMTIASKRIILGNFFEKVVKPCDKISTLDIRAYLYQYQQERKISNRSLDAIRSHLRAFFEWCAAEKFIPASPAAIIPIIKSEKKERKALTPMELEKLRMCCKTPLEAAFVEVLFSTGCRISELIGLKKSDIDWENASVDVLGKGNKHRTCYLNVRAYMRLKEYIASKPSEDNSEYIFTITHPFWHRVPWRGMSRSFATKILPLITSRNKELPKITAHILRHTTATTALRNGMPVEEVSLMLGHARLETTMIYAKVDKETLHVDHRKFVA